MLVKWRRAPPPPAVAVEWERARVIDTRSLNTLCTHRLLLLSHSNARIQKLLSSIKDDAIVLACRRIQLLLLIAPALVGLLDWAFDRF